MNLEVNNLWVINVFGVEIWITETIVNTWIIMAVLITLAVIIRVKLRNFKVVPTGFQNFVEAAVEAFDNFTKDTVGDRFSYIAPWFFMVFVFLLTSCLFSMFGLRAPTADWATTFAFSLGTFFIMIFMGLKHRKGKYLKSFIEPNVILLPINLIGEVAKPISLSFRLFGNMLSGTILLTLYYALTPLFLQIGIPAVLHAIFDVAFGALQTYIFVIISFMYVRGAAEENM